MFVFYYSFSTFYSKSPNITFFPLNSLIIKKKSYLNMSQQPSTSKVQQDRTPLVNYQDEVDDDSNIQEYEELVRSSEEEVEGTPIEEDMEKQEVNNNVSNIQEKYTSTVRSPGSLFSDYADPKAVMENIIHHYKVKLDRLLVQYNWALPSAGTEMLQSRQADIIKTQKTLFQFRAAYKQEHENGQDQVWCHGIKNVKYQKL